MYQLRIRSRNGSAAALRRQIPTAKRGVYRCGSFTPKNEIFTREELRNGIIEINTVEANKTSNNKTDMKLAFDAFGVKTASWLSIGRVLEMIANDEIVPLEFPWIIKHNHSSQGNGIYLVRDRDEFLEFTADPQHRHNHIVEHYYTYVREYRLHVDRFGCFCANRKMLREDATVRWHRHHSNSNWIREDNPLFDRPTNWDDIVAEAQKARRAVGLDICSVDIKVQSAGQREPKFFILETNAGSALGEQTTPLYIAELTRIADEKSRGIEEDFRVPIPNTVVTEETPQPELTQEEMAAVQQAAEMSDSPMVVTTAEIKSKRKSTSKCPGEFEVCDHLIWSGEHYGECDLNHRTCRVFNIDMFGTIDDDEDDDENDDRYNEDEDDNYNYDA